MRVVVAGATGALGGELVRVLSERRVGVSELIAVATERSVGRTIEFRDQDLRVETELPDLRSVDLVFLCAPPAASMPLGREALKAETACIDLSGAFAGAREVPLVAADLPGPRERVYEPLLAIPAGPSLAWALTLAPLQALVGLTRVVGTTLQASSSGGLEGMDSLSRETIALLNQQELPDPTVFERNVAFDCALAAPAAEEGAADPESLLICDLERLLGPDVRVSASLVRVPTFVGDASSLAVETERPVDWASLASELAKAPGLELWDTDPRTPSTRSASGCERVIVGRLRRDPSIERGVLLWIVADPLRLAASQAARLAELRFQSH